MNSSRNAIWGYVFSGLVLAFFVLFAEFDPVTLNKITLEDGPIETFSAVCFALACFGFLMTMKKSEYLKSQGSILAYFMLGSWCFLMFVFAGEELSWGQRIFNFSTPEKLAEVNLQNEFNIHNIEIVDNFMGGKYRYLSLMMLLTGLVFPLMVYNARLRALFARFYFPVAPLHFCIIFVGAYVYGKYYVVWNPVEGIRTLNTFTEVREMLLGLAMACFALQGMRNPDDIIMKREESGIAVHSPAE